MDITVTFRHLEPMDSLKEYAEEKASKIEKYFDFPVEFHIVLVAEKFRRMADVTLNVNGTVIKAMDKIEKQVKRYRDKTARKRRVESRKNEGSINLEEIEVVAGSSQEEPRIENEKLFAKPMDPEEAAMQLVLSQQEFLVFRNSRSRDINVIYKRKDGNLGLIEPSN